MCEFHDCNCNGLGDIWWTDKCMYFSSIDGNETKGNNDCFERGVTSC